MGAESGGVGVDMWERKATKRRIPTDTSWLPRLLLMFDRWRKLLKAFFNEKKHAFDISKVPDIYDSAKYDAIHNAHLGPPLKEVFDVSPPPPLLDCIQVPRCGRWCSQDHWK